MTIFINQIYAADRYLRASGDWTDNVWSTSANGILGASAPGINDVVFIQRNNTVTLSSNVTVAAINFSTYNTGNLGVLTINENVTLTVNGATTLYNASAAVNASINGFGTLTTSQLNIGNDVNPGTNGTYTHTLVITNTNINVSGDLNIQSERGGSNSQLSNGVLNIVSGTVTVNGTVSTDNDRSVNTATLTLGNSSPTLILNGATPFTISGTGTSTITLNGTGATVVYGSTGNQTVRQTTYTNLTLAGGGTKTTTGTTVNGILSMEGTATASAAPTYGSNATIQYNSSDNRTVGPEWPSTFSGSGGVVVTNTGTVTLNAAKTLNTGIQLKIEADATLNTNNYSLTLGGDFINNGILNAGSSNITINGTANQSIGTITTTGSFSTTKTGGTATLTGNISAGAFTLNSAGGTLNLGNGLTHTFTGTANITAGNLNGGSSTINLNGAIITSGGSWIAGTSTVNYGGTAQNVMPVTYYNLQLSGSGAKTINAGTSVSNNLDVTGTASATLSQTLSISGNTTIHTGASLTLAAANRLSENPFILSGGTFSTGSTTGYTETLGTLQVNANSTIQLGTGSHTLTFAASNSQSWSGELLTINGWSGSEGGSGTAGRIFVGNNSNGLTASQLAKIEFTGFGTGATLLSTGELVPAVKIQVWKSGVFQASYSTLKQTFDAINAGTHTGALEIRLNKSTTEGTAAILNASGTGSANYSSINIFPTAANIIISGSLNGNLIQLDGADNVRFDGRMNMEGAPSLSIINNDTGTSARTIELINSAENNALEYLTIKGAGTGTSLGTINLSTSSAGNGNDNNVIAFCKISGISNTARASNSIYSAGISGRENSGNKIRNNDIFDFLSRSTNSNAILIAANSTDFTITANSFYETTSLVPTANVTYSAIRVNNSSANDIVITNNYIGGSQVQCGGSAFTKSAANNEFSAINMSVGSTNNSLQGNVISNFNFANSGNASFRAIEINAGTVAIGTVNGNIIGAETGNASIVYTNATNSGIFTGIYLNSGSNTVCSNNKIGSINTANISTNSTHFYGIHKTATAGNITITNNTVGSTSTTNSINTTSAATGNAQLLYGIYNLGTGSINISANTVANLRNSTTENTLSSRTRGIFSEAGTNVISNNSVYNIISGGRANAANYPGAAIVGISLINKTEGLSHNISTNTVHSLETTNTGAIEIYGIYFDGANNTESIISRNFVHTFVVPSNGSTGSYLHGISVFDGNFISSNNIVYLGANINIGCSIWGLWTNSDNHVKIYHNTVYLSGTASDGTSNSYALRSLNCPASIDIRNNILWDGRVNSSGTISHFAIYLNCNTNTTVNYNDYQYAQQFGRVGGTTYTTFANWKSGTGLDGNSLNTNPQLVNLGGILPVDYQSGVQLVGDPTLLSTITTDYNNITRSTPTMGAWEFFDNPVEIWNGTTFRKSYPKLRLAFNDINNGTYTGDLIIKFRGNTNEDLTAKINASGTGAASYSRILIYPARLGVIVKGNIAGPLVEMDGARNVTFDGRIDGSGTANEFSFANENTGSGATTSTFHFNNAAQNDTIRYCNIKGAGTSASSGVVLFGNTGNGNSSNVIEHNNLTNSENNRPVNMVYSGTNNTSANTGNIIRNNNIYNFLNPAITSYGINIAGNSTAFTISNNSFYETSNFAPTTTATYYVVNINNTSGNNFSISGNYIGGNAALASGTWAKTSGSNNPFFGIYVNAGTSNASSVQGNIIRNFTYSNTTNANWNGIYIQNGLVDIGTSAGNSIGATTGTNSIQFTNATTGGYFYGINLVGGGNVTCENNSIGSITTSNTNAANATNFIGINKENSSGITVINKNLIGSLTSANSINTAPASTSNAQILQGIVSAGTGAITINENTTANLTNSTSNTNTATRGLINGIAVSAGSSNTINQNTVRNLIINNLNSTGGSDMSVSGINLTSTVANRTVSGNNISNLTNQNASFAGYISGIYYQGSTSGTNTVSRNFIHSLNSAVNGILVGIAISSGVTSYHNNIIYLGGTTGNRLYGIYDVGVSGQTCNLYFNTVYMDGSSATANYHSFAVYTNGTNTRNYQNNLLVNSRANAGGVTNYHYCLGFNGTNSANLTLNYNDYYTTSTNGRLYQYNSNNYNSIPLLSGQDANSISRNPVFFTNLNTTNTGYYKTQVTLSGTSISGITTDYGLNSRPANAPTMGAWEFNVNKWYGGSSTNWGTASNWTGNTVPGVDATIEFHPSPVRDCIMDIDRSVTDIINAQGTYNVITNGKKLTIKGNLVFSNGAKINASAAGSELIFAGNLSQSIAAGVLANNEVYNLTVNNPNNVTLNGTIRLLNNITAQNGQFDAYSNTPTIIFAGTALQNINEGIFRDAKAQTFTIDNGTGVQLNTNLILNNNLNINSGKKFIISAAKTLRVNGLVSNSAGTGGLTIKASPTLANGSLIYFNSFNNGVQATVELYSPATWNLSNPDGQKFNWQFFGIPVRPITADPTFYGAYVRKKLESGTTMSNHWQQLQNESVIEPFYGYELVQPTAKTYSISGTLVNSNFNSGPLPITTGAIYPGQHLFANPYAAAIDIRQIEFGSSMEASVYLYNTGTFSQWSASPNSKTGGAPGQYTAVPQQNAGLSDLPVQIPSMGSMLVRVLSADANAYISLNYNSVIMGNTDRLRTPAEEKTDAKTVSSTRIEVEGENGADKMWIITKPTYKKDFDNGGDGYKHAGNALSPQIFAVDKAGKLQVNATNDMNNLVVAFQAGQDTKYQMKFIHENTEEHYSRIFLHDLVAKQVVDITENGSIYNFEASSTPAPVERFLLVSQPANLLPVSDENRINVFSAHNNIYVYNLSDLPAKAYLFDAAGRQLSQADLSAKGVTGLTGQQHTVLLLKVVFGDKTITQKIVID
jgi:putative cofactor-binding repeat protein